MIEKLDTEKLRFKILKSLFFIFVIFGIFTVAIIFISQGKGYENKLGAFHKTFHKTIDHVFEDNARCYTNLIKRFFINDKIKELIVANNREELYEILKPKFDLLKAENKYIELLHIVKSNGESFLRVHEKLVFGDNLIDIRPMVKRINKNKKILVGYETGKYATAFRVMYPLFLDGKYIGFIEIGINPNYFVGEIEEIIGEKGALFIKKEKLQLFSIKSDYLLDGYALQTKLDKNSLMMLKKLPINYDFENCTDAKYEGKRYIFHVHDGNKYNSEKYAKYIFMQNITGTIKAHDRTIVLLILALSVFFIFIFISVKFYLTKFDNKLAKLYLKYIEDIKFKENYLRIVEDNSANLIITSCNKKLFSANKKFFDFSGFDNVENFSKKYDCICDLFIKRDGYINGSVNKKYWINYILDNSKKTHKVIMLKDGIERIFKITASRLDVDEKDRCVATFVDITKSIKLEKQLKEKNKIYSNFFENTKSANIIYTTKDNGKTFLIKDMNCLVEKLEKLKKEEVLGKRIDEVWEGVEEFGLLNMIKKVYKTNEPMKKPLGLYEDERIKGWRENYIFKISNDDIVVSYDDKTKEKELKKDLDEQSYLLEEAQKIAHIGSWKYIAKTKEIIWSDEVYSIFEVIDRSTIKYFDDFKKNILKEDVSMMEKAFFDSIKNKTKYKSMHRILTQKTKKIKYVEDRCEHIFDNDGLLVESVGTVQDITGQELVRIALREKEEIMMAQSRHAAMGEMISMIAHQWRQPLSVIAMGANNIMADIELETIEEDTLKNSVSNIMKQTQELSKTIDDFRNFFRPGKKIEKILVSDVFDDALKIVGKSLDNNDIKVVVQFESTKKIQTYSRELMQVLVNLLKNAKEAFLQKDIEEKKIFISTKDYKNKIIISVCDNAGGIDEKIINKIFEPYFSTKDEKTGTGLGLYMSKIIIEKHLKGNILAFNDNDCACFEIRLKDLK